MYNKLVVFTSVAVVWMIEQLFPKPEIRGSNPRFVRFFWPISIAVVICSEGTKVNKKGSGVGAFKIFGTLLRNEFQIKALECLQLHHEKQLCPKLLRIKPRLHISRLGWHT